MSLRLILVAWLVLLAGCDGLPAGLKRGAGEADASAAASDANDPDAVQSATLDVVPEAEPADGEIAPEPADPPETAEAVEPVAPEKPDANAAARARCVAGGGNYTRTPAGGNLCVNRTRDANKSCTSSNQCEGQCLARSGTCAPVKPLVGCHDIITDGGGMATLCVD